MKEYNQYEHFYTTKQRYIVTKITSIWTTYSFSILVNSNVEGL